MRKTLRQMIYMKAALWVNAFFYYCKRLWGIGSLVPDSIYANERLKKVLAVAAVVIQQLLNLCGKPVYLLLCVGVPFLSLASRHPDLQTSGMAFLTQVLFFLSGILGGFGDSQVFSVTRDKITCIKYLHMNARTYIQSGLAFKYIPFALGFLPWLLLAAHLLGGTLLQGVSLWLMLLFFRMLSEAVHVLIFDRTGAVLSRNMLYDWVVIVLGLAGAYVPALLGWNWRLDLLLLHPVSTVVYLVLGSACLWYICVGYPGYERKFHRSIDLNYLLSTLLKSSSGSSAGMKEVEIRQKDQTLSAADEIKFRKLKGFSYFNALFFARHRRQLVKPVIYRLIVSALMFVAGVVLLIADRAAAVRLSTSLTAMLPFFVYIMYFMTVADKASRAMFYNCDKDMLHFTFYRQPQTLLRNFQIRLLRVSLYDLTIAGAVCLAAIGFCLLCGTSIFTADLFLFCAAILLLSILFTVHHLCLYYIFQPYAVSLQVKNPFYSLINGGMYVLCFMCLKIDVGGFAFTMAVLAFTVLYIIGALVLVYHRAPQSFRIK